MATLGQSQTVSNIAVPEGFKWGNVDAEAYVAYANMRIGCCVPFKAPQPDIMSFSDEMSTRTTREVIISASAGSDEDCLEAGLRVYNGCGIAPNIAMAIGWWDRIAVPTTRKRIRVRALSCLASVTHSLRDQERDGRPVTNIDAMLRAAVFANECAAVGFVTPAVLVVGFSLKDLLATGNIPADFDRRTADQLDFLWEAVEKRLERFEKAKEKRDAKVSDEPTAFTCAAEGCGIEGTKRSALLRCAGPCSMETKPSYCSKECQTADWRRHKPFCKPSSGKTDPSSSTADSQIVLVRPDTGLASSSEESKPRDDGRKLQVDIPSPLGGPAMTVVSSTMAPELMKEIRDEIGQMNVQ
ncbi:hypothetical protein EIP91_009570 [Steccherinum ochraceum]|uniref:MYND-type domain-containing protein n=1 Tax=Steccherinum ochraceum TaxID=92696 RepID=A0A4R0RMK0_9APHY|nr:hypothetical protein EIP91_009570 [Steccherinum ochraceum]